MTQDGLPSEKALSDDFEITRQMFMKAEGPGFSRSQAEQKMYDFRLLREVVKNRR